MTPLAARAPTPAGPSRAPAARRQRASRWTWLPALLLCLLPGCASEEPTIYVHPNADLAVFRRLAVLPLENLTNERFAGDRVREILVTELLAQDVVDVVEVGEVNRVLRAANVGNLTELGPDAIRQLGEGLGAQGLLFGSVMEYDERRTGTFTAPEISLGLRLVDVETGLVVWSASDSRTGLGVMTRLFGVGEQTHSETVRELVRSLLERIFDLSGV